MKNSQIPGYRNFAGVDTNNFAKKTDAEIIEGGRAVLRQHDPKKLRPYARRVLSARFAVTHDNAVIAGTILWAALCGWKPAYLLKS